jgi:hypothetical protein
MAALTSLNLAACLRVTDIGLTAIARRCRSMRELVVASCTEMTNTGMQEVGYNLRVLRSLSINRCMRVTDPGLAAISVGCTQLTSLNIAGCEDLTDMGLQIVARKCRILRVLNLCQVRRITNVVARDLAARCPGLHTVQMIEVDEVTGDALQAMAAALPLAKLSEAAFGLEPAWPPACLGVRSAFLEKTLLVDHYVTQVQRAFRGFGAKRLLQRIRQETAAAKEALRNAAATKIQRRVLTWIARKWFKWMAHRRWNAALYIQSWYKSELARIYVKQLRREFRRHTRAARRIQCNWRGYKGRERARRLLWAKRRAIGLVNATRMLVVAKAGLTLQSWWRMCSTRMYYRTLHLRFLKATVYLQRIYRGAKVRSRIAIVAARLKWLAVQLQAHVRAVFARRRVWALRLEWCRRHQAATMLQRIYKCVILVVCCTWCDPCDAHSTASLLFGLSWLGWRGVPSGGVGLRRGWSGERGKCGVAG